VNEGGSYRDETDSRLYNWVLIGGGPHRLDFLDVNGDGFVDILTSDHGSALCCPGPFEGNGIMASSRLLINDGTGHFVTTIHQQINDRDGFKPSFIPSLDAPGRLRWTVIDANGTPSVDVITRSLDVSLSTGPNMTNPRAWGAPGFNEFYYLLKYPDVRAAIEAGTYETGLAHYLEVGRAEGREAHAPGAKVE
jgi:hypothetical protein